MAADLNAATLCHSADRHLALHAQLFVVVDRAVRHLPAGLLESVTQVLIGLLIANSFSEPPYAESAHRKGRGLY